jgi:HPt (histidine-containing phosphotransfer) domain-containing protein
MQDQDLVGTVIATFLDDMPGQIALLREAVSRRDLAGAGAQAHRIKGAAGNAACPALGATAAAMESAGKSGDADLLQRLMTEMETRFVVLKPIMEERGECEF